MMWYIKERHSQQLGVYYVACGQLTKKEAKAMEKTLYGDNFLHGFANERQYLDELARLRRIGEKVHDR